MTAVGATGGIATAHAESGGGNSTRHSANDSGKSSTTSSSTASSSTRRDKPAHRAPRTEKLRRAGDPSVRSHSLRSLPKPSLRSLPTPEEARGLVGSITDQARAAVTDIVNRSSEVRTAQNLSRLKPARKRDVPEVPRLVDSTVVEKSVPEVAEATGVIAHPDEAKAPPAQLNTIASITTQGRALHTGVAEQVSKTRAARPIAQLAAAIGTPAIDHGPVPLVNLVGSVVFNVVGAALQVFSGSPVVPAGSNVTVHTSTLTMPGSNRAVRADWYFPEDPDAATGVIYLQHGFMATGPMYSYTAAYLAEHTNSIVVAPTLSSNLFDPDGEWIGGEPMQQSVADLFSGDRAELTASASAAAGEPVTLPTKFVLVGHSLGGMLVTGAAGRMVDNGAVEDLAGVVLLDAVDTDGDMPDALAELSGPNYRPVLVISSERYVWNLDGTVGDELAAARPGQFNGVMLVGGRHIDGLQGPNPILQFAEYLIAGFSQQPNIDAVKTISAGWINDMYDGTHNGVYGAPQQRIDIPTASGTATAVVLPFTSTESVQATPWDGVAKVILDVLFKYAVYEPPAGQSVALAV
ncbi:alpha/beta fold hydrolase [Mycobacterium sp. TNTM28]|uniref:Alpha/beta fold hydrolase n=2 Tax=[Mycobacterium] fortunisiensis TaxID=2600579 RepID=A0ABS6KJ23_9MYCO|nr:alpha/beta fold hydrolase [[Mycobacterium] fortunisiensis]